MNLKYEWRQFFATSPMRLCDFLMAPYEMTPTRSFSHFELYDISGADHLFCPMALNYQELLHIMETEWKRETDVCRARRNFLSKSWSR